MLSQFVACKQTFRTIVQASTIEYAALLPKGFWSQSNDEYAADVLLLVPRCLSPTLKRLTRHRHVYSLHVYPIEHLSSCSFVCACLMRARYANAVSNLGAASQPRCKQHMFAHVLRLKHSSQTSDCHQPFYLSRLNVAWSGRRSITQMM